LERRDALLDAALRCFTARGLLRTGIEEIRREAGASPSSVYNLFADRNDLVLALLTRTFERLFSHIVQRTSRPRTAKGLVVAIVDAHLEWILDNPDEGRFLYQATALELAPGASAALQRRKAELLAPVVTRLTPFVESGELPRWPTPIFDIVLLGPSHEACRRFLAGAPLDPTWMRHELPRLAWGLVSARRA
jgi:AcrR family transcriptional regulator